MLSSLLSFTTFVDLMTQPGVLLISAGSVNKQESQRGLSSDGSSFQQQQPYLLQHLRYMYMYMAIGLRYQLITFVFRLRVLIFFIVMRKFSSFKHNCALYAICMHVHVCTCIFSYDMYIIIFCVSQHSQYHYLLVKAI